MIADPLANVNRWRAEIGLTPVDNDSLASVTQPIIVDGETAIYTPAIPDTAKAEESAAAQATLAVDGSAGQSCLVLQNEGGPRPRRRPTAAFKDFLNRSDSRPTVEQPMATSELCAPRALLARPCPRQRPSPIRGTSPCAPSRCSPRCG